MPNRCASVTSASWRAHGWRVLGALLLVVGAGCAANPAGQAERGSMTPVAVPERVGPKAITIILPIDPISLGGGIQGNGLATVPTRYFKEFPNAYLTTYNPQDETVPWLATQLPSLDDGTWRVLDDGRMEITWKLRPGVRWQDGAELSSDDLKFGWEINKDPTTQIGAQGIARLVEAVETPDPLTAVFMWAQPSALGAQAGVREFDVLPRHLLEGVERGALINHPYFADPAAFIGSGPFRVTAWEQGSAITLEAFDGYFLGRPKLDRVTFATIGDNQTALANLLAGQVHIAYWAIAYEGSRIVQQEWARTGAGTVEMQPNNARHLLPQFRPDYARPRDLQDVRVRQALMYAMDRPELAEAAAAGAAQVVNSTTYPDSALGRVVEARSISYAHDPARAAALFAEAGWEKGPDGILAKGGERFHFEYLTGSGTADAVLIFPVLQQHYQRVGVELAYTRGSPGDLQVEALFPGVWFTALPDNQTGFLNRFNSAQIATAQNRWAGNDRHGYANPAADALLRRIDRTLRRDDRMDLWAEANRLLLDEVAYMPLYNYPYPYVVRKEVVGPLPANPINPPSYFVHQWDLR